ncbi:MAG TPA: RDD family protein [Solirubrobacter sp.]|nr:RDD family protein [Solirubrobacter sp.]
MTGYTSPAPPGAGGPRPQYAPSGQRLAGWWRRAGAAVIDGLIVLGFATLLLVAILAALDASAALIVTVLVWIPCVTVVALLYAPAMMARTGGRTLGRIAAGTRVVRADGRRLTFGWALLREVVLKWGLFYGVGGAVTAGIAPLVDVLWPLWDEQKRALHDLLAGTRTIRA